MPKPPKVDADIVECRDRSQRLLERANSVGSSDTPAILGQSGDYANAVSVWADKVRPPTFSMTTERQQWGLDLEGPIAAAYTRKYGGQVKQWPQTVIARSRETPIMHCTPDGLAYDPDRDGPGDWSCKTWSEWDRKAWAEEPPLYVQIQSQHIMYVNQLQWGVVAVLFGNSELQRFYIERNDRFIAAMLTAVREFWNHVVTRTPPEIDGSPATTRALARLHPNDSGLACMLPQEADDLIEHLRGLKLAKANITSEIDAIENQFRAWLGDNTYGLTEQDHCVAWKSQTRRAYSVPETTYRVLREIKKPKGLALPAPATTFSAGQVDYKVAERKSLPRALKEELLAADPRCRWCGCTLTGQSATFEHVVPLAVGGTNDRNNLDIACEKCNAERGAVAHG